MCDFFPPSSDRNGSMIIEDRNGWSQMESFYWYKQRAGEAKYSSTADARHDDNDYWKWSACLGLTLDCRFHRTSTAVRKSPSTGLREVKTSSVTIAWHCLSLSLVAQFAIVLMREGHILSIVSDAKQKTERGCVRVGGARFLRSRGNLSRDFTHLRWTIISNGMCSSD